MNTQQLAELTHLLNHATHPSLTRPPPLSSTTEDTKEIWCRQAHNTRDSRVGAVYVLCCSAEHVLDKF